MFKDLTVKIDADADEAVEEIERVTKAIEELNEALEELGGSSIDVSYGMDLYNSSANQNFRINKVTR